MIFNLNILPNTIKNISEYGNCISNSDRKFKLLSIDKDSYIVSAKVETGLDFRLEDGVYNLQIGRYSALAEDILFMIDIDHNYLSVNQGIISVLAGDKINNEANNEEEARKKNKVRKGQIIIQNDCWIGHGATIMNGVTIHNGAVVGAEAVVTKDVPPYAIVGGNPAKVLKYRFDKEIVDKLEKISWWNWDDQKIVDNAFYFTQNVEAFASAFIDDAEKIIFENSKEEFKAISDKDKYLFYIDFDEEFPIYKNVIARFAEKFNHFEAELVLVMPADVNQEKIDLFLEYLDYYRDNDIFINIINYNQNEMSIFSEITYYITNRLPENIKRMGFARIYQKECISGVDIPLFHTIYPRKV